MAGHSLGEYGALCAAGAMSFSDALQIVQARAAYQQEAVPPGLGANAAIQGLGRDTVEAICLEVTAESGLVSPSCSTRPGPDRRFGLHVAGRKGAWQRPWRKGRSGR